MKKVIKKKKSAKKRVSPTKKLARQKAAPKNAKMKRQAPGTKSSRRGRVSSLREEVREKSRGLDPAAFVPEVRRPRRPSGDLSGDLQGLSNLEEADSESVAELLEEGNAFEADVVKGVEDAPDADAGPIRTHEVPEDDVTDDEIPDEYKREK